MSTPVTSGAPPKRLWRNYLLDARFQLKFTLFIVAVSLFVAALLGASLFGTTRALLRETEAAVEARSRAADASQAVSSATLNNLLLAQIDDPVFVEALQKKSEEIDKRFEDERAAVIAQRAELVKRQRLTWWVLGGCLLGFLFLVTLGTIVATHKIVGPLMRIERVVTDVMEGKWVSPPPHLREGDELQELYELTVKMVEKLHAQGTSDVQALSSALALLEAEATTKDAARQLRQLEQLMRARLEKK